MATPRGIRNCNPGNLRKSPEKWLGEVQGQDEAFKVFSEPVYGLRAIAKLLLNYERRYGLNTVSGLISRWAPTNENDTAAYIDAVARACGVGAGVPIDVAAYLPSLIPAIVLHENGMQPYSGDMIAQAIALATGVENAQAPADVAATSAEPAAPVLPAQGLRDEPGAGPAVVGPVGDAVSATPGLGALIADVSKYLGKNPSSYGALGLFGMLVGNVRIQCKLWVWDHLYEFSDANILAALVAVVLIVWGLVGKRLSAGVGKTLVPLVLVGLLALPGCAGFHPSGAGPEAAGLRADGPAPAETTQVAATTLPARIKAGIAWLWASYTRLHDAGALPGLDDLRADIVDLEAVAHRGDLAAALDLYTRARDRVTKVAGALR